MEKIVKIKVCDCCQQEADRFWDFIIPWPDTIIAYGGKNQVPIVCYGENFYCKEIELCDKCATNFARFLAQTVKPEGVKLEWEK